MSPFLFGIIVEPTIPLAASMMNLLITLIYSPTSLIYQQPILCEYSQEKEKWGQSKGTEYKGVEKALLRRLQTCSRKVSVSSTWPSIGTVSVIAVLNQVDRVTPGQNRARLGVGTSCLAERSLNALLQRPLG